MADPLKYKAETVIAEFLKIATGVQVFTGQNPNPAPPPCILVYAGSVNEAFPDAMPKNVRLTVEIVSGFDLDANSNNISGDADDRSTGFEWHRTLVQKVEARLQDIETLQSYANAINISNRPVTGFYVYDIQEDSQQSTMSGEDRVLISVIGVTLVCEAQDNV